MSADIFAAHEISKSFGLVHALTGVSVGIRAGEVHAIIGENGAGKSTLMNIFCGRLQPTHGTLRRLGEPVVFRSPAASQAAGDRDRAAGGQRRQEA